MFPDIEGPRPEAYVIPLEFDASLGFTDPDSISSEIPTVFKAGVTGILYKFAQADYFCRMLLKCPLHEPAWMFHLDAFLGALRATWEMFRRAPQVPPDFVEHVWKDFCADPRLAPFITGESSLRNKSFHEALDVPRAWTIRTERFYRDGRQESSFSHKRFEIGGKTFEDANQACVDALLAMQPLMELAFKHGIGRPIRTDARVMQETRFEFEQADGSWATPIDLLKRKRKPPP